MKKVKAEEAPMEEKDKNKVVHTVRISGLFNSPPNDKEIYQAMKEFQRIQRFLRWMPLLFITIIGVVFYIVMKLFELNFSGFIIIIVSTIFLLKELGTLLFSFQMRNRIMKPLEKLRVAVDEISKGHYGFTVEEDELNMVGDLISSFNNMSVKLKEADDLKEKYELNRKELIAGISHDLKSPITSIIGYVDAIQTGVATTEEKRDKYLSIIESNAQYTNKLIDDLFLFSKLDINQMKYEFIKLPIREFLEDVIVEKKLEFEEQGIRVDYNMDINNDQQLAIDGKMVYRIMSNILSNAVKYGDKEMPRIYINATKVDEGVEVRITDNGPGIPEKNVRHIFDVFYRGDASRNKEIGGTGLGLAIAKQLVEAHGGTIYAESEIGVGTSIVFSLKERNHKEDYNG